MATGRRRGRAVIYIALILILLLIAVFAVVQFNIGGLMGNGGGGGNAGGNAPANAPTPEPTPIMKIVAVRSDIRRGDPVRPEQVFEKDLTDAELQSITPEKLNEEYYTRIDDVVQSNGRALFDLKPNTPLRKDLIYTPGISDVIPAFEIPTGKVAISVPVNRLSTVSYGLQKGDHVNVLVSLLMIDVDTNWQSALPNRTGSILAAGPVKEETQTYLTGRFEMSPDYTSAAAGADSFFGRVELEPTVNQPAWVIPGEPQRSRLVSQTLLQDAIILQMGNFEVEGETVAAAAAPDAQATPEPGAQGADGAEVPAVPAVEAPNIITLIVDPQDAVTLNYLMLAGAKLNLVMRSAGDTQRIDTEAVTLQFILDQYQITNPAKLPYSLSPRMDQFPEVIMPFPEPGPLPTPPPQ